MSRIRGLELVVILGGAIACAAGPVRADIAISHEAPVTGRPATVTVTADGSPASGAAVEAVYRPGSEVSHTEALGRTGPDGSLPWTPTDAGVVTLKATLPAAPGAEPVVETRNLSVRFKGAPVFGVVIMVLAGVILYGGVIRGFRLMGQPPLGLRPDT
jgi:hypothetical protein